MNACPTMEELDELALDGGSAGTRAHAESCPRCAQRLRWLLKEGELVRDWAAQDDASTAHLWQGVQSRLAASRRRRWILGPAVAAAVAAGLVLTARSFRVEREEPEATASAAVAIDRAEAEYGRAIEALEAQVNARPQKQGASLARARSGLLRARAASGRDPSGRVRLLEGYATYLKSLRRALREGE